MIFVNRLSVEFETSSRHMVDGEQNADACKKHLSKKEKKKSNHPSLTALF